MARKRKIVKVIRQDSPPALRLVWIKGISAGELADTGIPAVTVHMNDARDDKPCDIAFSYGQLKNFIERLSDLLPKETKSG